MITENYVSFEVAKLLKEKGFDARCRYYYIQTGEMFEIDARFHTVLTTQELLNLQIVGEKEERCVAPTLQMAMKWLRKVHKIFIEPKMSKNTFLWGYRVSVSNGSTVCLHANIFNECEEACEEAIKYCLENLI